MNISTPEHRARAELRANFLYALCELNGEPCEITTFELSKLSCIFKAWKTDGEEFLVQGLQTPTGQNMKTALMRTSDIISVEFDNNVELPSRCKVNTQTPPGDFRYR